MVDTEKYYSLKVLSDPFVEGNWAYFVQNWIEDDQYRSSIYRFDGKTVERVTYGGSEKAPKIHNGSLYYISYNDEEESLNVLEPLKEPRTLFSDGSISKFIFHGKSILLIAKKKGNEKEPIVTKRLKYRSDTKGYHRTRPRIVFLNDEPPQEIISGEYEITDIASDGKRVIFTSTMEDDDRGLTDVYELNLSDKSCRKVTQGSGEVSHICLSDSGEIVYAGHRKGVSPWGTMDLIFPESGKSVPIGKSAESSVNSDLFVPPSSSLIFDSGKYYTIGQDKGESFVYCYDGKTATEATGKERSARSFDVSNGKLAYIYTSHKKPSVLVFGGEYDPNPEVPGKVPEHFELNGKDAWLLLYSKDVPTVLAVHGGPQTAYGYAYSIEFNFLADHGYNVLFGNPRGSSGYGEEFAKACVGDWGRGDYEDLLGFMDEAVRKFGIRDEFAITGGSYGGYMTNNAIVKTSRFKCAVSERCVSNLLSMCGTSDIGFWFNAVEAGVEDPWSEDGMKALLEFSPLTKAKNVKTPTLFIHGEEDYRCPIEQSEQMYTAVRMNGADAVLARYPGDSHEHARKGVPANMKDRLARKLEWFNKYMGAA